MSSFCELLISGPSAKLSSEHHSLLAGRWEIVQTLFPLQGFHLAVPLRMQLGAAWSSPGSQGPALANAVERCQRTM